MKTARDLKITDLRARAVAIPTRGMLRHSRGVHPGYFLRTVIELVTDEGLIGLGEVGGDQRAAFAKIKARVLGLSAFEIETIKLRALGTYYLIQNSALYGALETACLDVQGKACGVAVHQLLGGKVRDAVPLIAYLFWRYDRPGGGDDTRAEDMANFCVELKETLGVTAMKLKAGVLAPKEEARALELCRLQLGDGFGLRIDPNGSWSVATAVRIGRRLEALDLQYYEDPAWGLEGMRAVHEGVRIPLATNMFPFKFDDLGPALRLNCVDVILTDLHFWEGPRGVKDLCAVCRTFNLGVAMHSGAEFGVELAAMLHTAATIPTMHLEGDAHYHYLEDDIIAGGKMKYEGGAIRVPDGPGLGVELDEEKMRQYERYYEEKGDFYGRYYEDPRRPRWHPVIGAV